MSTLRDPAMASVSNIRLKVNPEDLDGQQKQSTTEKIGNMLARTYGKLTGNADKDARIQETMAAGGSPTVRQDAAYSQAGPQPVEGTPADPRTRIVPDAVM
ncbi:hypothetical protein HDU85_007035 [Gaertneriomyces sp. JEL0708]|nr:hypothetical protein HDU85_007035 [Gaertneriomyces sp. JEL0708]